MWTETRLLQSLSGFLSILKIVPYHLGVLLQLGPLFSELSEFHRGMAIYLGALELFEQTMPDGPSMTEDPMDFRLLLITLADFCHVVGEHEQSITTIRNGTRWMDGRASQKYWAAVPDDREFDPVGYVRTMSLNEATSRPQGFFSLDVNLRQRLAVARLALGDLEEGQVSVGSCGYPRWTCSRLLLGSFTAGLCYKRTRGSTPFSLTRSPELTSISTCTSKPLERTSSLLRTMRYASPSLVVYMAERMLIWDRRRGASRPLCKLEHAIVI